MKRKIIVFLIFLSLTWLSGETYECVYMEGDVLYRDGADWVGVDFGTRLESGSRIKVESYSSVQWESSRGSLFFTKPGEYLLEQKSTVKAQESSLAVIQQKLENLFSESDGNNAVAMGIRGDETGLDDDLGFGSTSKEDVDAAWALMDQGKHGRAEDDLEYLYQMSADPLSESYLLFTLAYAEEKQGKSGEAWTHLQEIFMAEEETFYPSYLLLKGQLALKGQDYQSAAEAYREYLAIGPKDGPLSEINTLLELCESQAD